MPRLALYSWPQVERYLSRSTLILVPIGSTEQHGPNGLLGTDFMTAAAVAEEAAVRLGALVAPAINVGMALHHMAFTGTISLKPETLAAVIGDYVASLYEHGFRTVVFVNGHGGNTKIGKTTLAELAAEVPEASLRWLNWYEAPAVAKRARELYGDREGQHATPSEISVTMAVAPGSVEPIEGPLDITNCRPRGIADAATFRSWYPDGRMGSDPSMACPEHGVELLELAVEDVVAEVRAAAGAVDVVAEVQRLLDETPS